MYNSAWRIQKSKVRTSEVGDSEGPNVGITVGRYVGVWVGFNVDDLTDGLIVSWLLTVGLGVNLIDGLAVGFVVGLAEGFIVGLVVNPFAKSLTIIEHSNTRNKCRNIMILYGKLCSRWNTTSAGLPSW